MGNTFLFPEFFLKVYYILVASDSALAWKYFPRLPLVQSNYKGVSHSCPEAETTPSTSSVFTYILPKMDPDFE